MFCRIYFDTNSSFPFQKEFETNIMENGFLYLKTEFHLYLNTKIKGFEGIKKCILLWMISVLEKSALLFIHISKTSK